MMVSDKNSPPELALRFGLEVTNFSKGNPLLVRRGGRDIKKNVAKPPLTERTGWSRTEPFHRTRPPRLRRLRWLRAIFLLAQPPLLTRRGLSPLWTRHGNSEPQYLARLSRGCRSNARQIYRFANGRYNELSKSRLRPLKPSVRTIFERVGEMKNRL